MRGLRVLDLARCSFSFLCCFCFKREELDFEVEGLRFSSDYRDKKNMKKELVTWKLSSVSMDVESFFSRRDMFRKKRGELSTITLFKLDSVSNSL